MIAHASLPFHSFDPRHQFSTRTQDLKSLKICELVSDLCAVTTSTLVATCHQRAIWQNRSKGTMCAMDHLYISKLALVRGAVTPISLVAPCRPRLQRIHLRESQQRHNLLAEFAGRF